MRAILSKILLEGSVILTGVCMAASTAVMAQNDIFKRPAQRHAFVFTWGADYAGMQRDLSQRGKILRHKPGFEVLHLDGAAEYKYSFFRKSRIREMVAKPVMRNGKQTMVLERLVLEPAEPPGTARLFAVMVHFPVPMPFQGEQKQRLMESLGLIYGKAVNRHRHYFDMENTRTQVRVYLRRNRGKTYVMRMVFSSRAISGERNAHIIALRRKATGENPTPVKSTTPGSTEPKLVRSRSMPTPSPRPVLRDKVLADTDRSPTIKLNERGTPVKNGAVKTRLIVEKKRISAMEKTRPDGP